VVYEAGYFGFWLHDRVVAFGASCTVTPPTLIPTESGNRVKTDRRDSRKLAHLLAKGLLKRVWVPSEEARGHRQVLRRRRQLISDRIRAQNRILAELRFWGLDLPEPVRRWTRAYVGQLHRLRFGDAWMQQSFERLLGEYEFLDRQVADQTRLLKQLAETEPYRDAVQVLRGQRGLGWLTAMELLLELGDVSRFRRGDQLAAYVGLTPSQYSSADKVRMGRITKLGKNGLRAALVESAWRVIARDPSLRQVYERIKVRAGAKRAIVAIARRLLLRARRRLLDRAVETAA
jgi:transposase